jgi:hypothetical protein
LFKHKSVADEIFQGAIKGDKDILELKQSELATGYALVLPGYSKRARHPQRRNQLASLPNALSNNLSASRVLFFRQISSRRCRSAS